MELPVDEEDDEKVVGVPERLEAGTAALLHRVPDHDSESDSHDPTRRAGPSGKVSDKESDEALTAGLRIRIGHRELGKVEHVRDDVHDGANNDGPCCGLVERDVLVEGNDLVEGSATEDGDEVSADGEEDEDDVHVEDKRSGTGDGWVRGNSAQSAR